MKKGILIIGLLLAVFSMSLSSCKSCTNNEPKTSIAHNYDGVILDFTAGVSHIQALHRQTMYSTLNVKDYEWRNSKVLFNDTIRLSNIDSLKVLEITDVFYYWDKVKGPQVQFIASNVSKGTLIPTPITDVWIEDADLSNKEIKLSAEDVLARLKEWNGVIPPAESMSLRYPVGPCECNAQWVIGDIFDVIFVDALTGEISNWNPAFNPNNKAKGGDFGKPLGEWP